MKRAGFVAAASGFAAGISLERVAFAQSTHLDIGTSSDPENGGLLSVAKRMQFFSKNGLDVTLKFFPSAGDMVSAMAAGALFMGTGATVPTATLRGGGFPVVVIAQQADISDAQEVVCSKDVKTPEDFEGKKVGVLFGTTPQMFADAMWQHYKVPPDKVTMVNLGPADMVTALLRGDIAGAVLWEPWSSKAVAGGAHRLLSGLNSYVPGQSGPSPLIGVHSVLVAPKPWVDSNPAIVSAALKSLIQASQFIVSNPQRCAEEVGAELKFSTPEMREMMAKNHYSVKIDPKLINDMRLEAAFLLKNGKLKSPVKPEDWVYPGPLAKVDPAMVSWQPPR